MTTPPYKLLLVEDNPRDAALFREYISRSDGPSHELEHVPSIQEATTLVASSNFDLIILDLDLEDVSGLDTFETMQGEATETPIVVLTGREDRKLADRMIEEGAQDYLLKEEINAHWLNKSIRYAIDRHGANQTIRENEQRQRLAQEIAGVGHWSIQLPDRDVYWSDEIYHILGLDTDQDEPTLEEALRYYHEDDRTTVQKHIDRAIEEGKEVDFELRIRRTTGEIRHVQAYGTPRYDERGNLNDIFGVFQDVTDMKQFQLELKERYKEQQCLYSIAEIPDDAFSEESTLLREIVDRIPPGFQRPEKTHARLTIEGASYTSSEFRETDHKQSSPIEINGERAGILAVFVEPPDSPPRERAVFLEEERDLIFAIAGEIGSKLGRRRADQQIKEQAELLDAINDRMPGVAFQFRRAPDGTYTIPYMSSGYEEIAGVPAEKAMEDFDEAIKHVHPEDRDELIESIESVQEEPDQWRYDYRFKLPDGTVNWVLGSSIPEAQSDGSIQWSGVLIDITDRKKMEDQLRESEQRFRQMAENIEEVFWITDPEKEEMIYISSAYEDVWGKSIKSLYENPASFLDAIHPDDKQRVIEEMEKQAEGSYDVEYRIVTAEDEVRWIRDRAFPIEDHNGEVYRITGLAEDITERKNIQHRLEQSLEQKEILLQEVHHRVRNNLQLITSLLGLQSRKTESAEALNALQNSKNRIQSMALIHRKLYETEDFHTIEFPTYVEELVSLLIDDLGPEGTSIDYQLEIDRSHRLNIDSLIPCGLIINELVTNSLKHGFQGRDSGTIVVSFGKHNGEYQLVISDDGKGWEGPQTTEELNSLGMRLVNNLVEHQLHGTIDITCDDGVTTSITFPPSEERY